MAFHEPVVNITNEFVPSDPQNVLDFPVILFYVNDSQAAANIYLTRAHELL
jgi:hypothetical protein